MKIQYDEYGKTVLKDISARLTEKYGNGWSVETLKKCRKFFEIYSKRVYSVDPIQDGIKSENWVNIVYPIQAAEKVDKLSAKSKIVNSVYDFQEKPEFTIPAGSEENVPKDLPKGEESSPKLPDNDESSPKSGDLHDNCTITAQKVPKELPKDFPKELPKQAGVTFDAIKNNPYATNDELAITLGISSRAVRNHIAALKEAGLIRREGSKTKGHWKILKTAEGD